MAEADGAGGDAGGVAAAAVETKTCLVGESGVGKSSISLRFCHGASASASILDVTPTIGASFLQKRVSYDSAELLLQIWDTAGQERFRSMAPMYYRNARAAILVFDVTDPETFDKIKNWRRDVLQYADDDCVLVLAANKMDKLEREDDFDFALAEEYAKSIGASLFRTSALTGEGIDALFADLVQQVLEAHRRKVYGSTYSGIKVSEEHGGGKGGWYEQCC